GTSSGTFAPFLNGNVLSLRQQLTSAASVQTISGLVFYPPKYKLQGGLSWQQREFGGTATFNYTASDTNSVVQAQSLLGSWYALALHARYSSASARGVECGLSARLSVLNVLNKDPPIVRGSSYVYDNPHPSPYGRIVKLDIEKRW